MKKYLVMLMAAFLILSGTAFAKAVSGTYAGTQNDGKSIWVNTMDETGAAQKAELWVSADTKWDGVAAVAEIKEGAQVSAEADQDDKGNWKATSVKVTNPPAEAAAPAPAQQ